MSKRYENSSNWQMIKSAVINAKCMCQCCETAPATDIHNVVNDNPDDAKISEIVPVCNSCRDEIRVAIKSGFFNSRERSLENIKERTKNILKDQEYAAYKKWLKDLHPLSEQEIGAIYLLPFVRRRVASIVNTKEHYLNPETKRVTGSQLLKIRAVIKLALYRKNILKEL